MVTKDLGIYVQIPFCASKCSFCNFSSKVAPQAELDSYLASLEREIDLLFCKAQTASAAEWQPSSLLLQLSVDSLYLGGGTPTLASRDRLARLFAALRRRFAFTAVPEITLELTPGSADAALLAVCRELGVNRLSIGAQSFDERELASVGRLHSGSDIEEQVRLARAAGFDNISLDLIAGLPYQTRASWLASLGRAIELEPEHVSVYLFEVDEKSRLGNEVLRHSERYHAASVPDEDFVVAAYEDAQELLNAAGFIQYEISNFARPGLESRHNRRYWRLEPYLGVGAGAHSFDGRTRWSNEVSTSAYGARVAFGDLPIAESHTLAEAEQIEEFFFLGLRERNGVDLAGAVARWGRDALDPWLSRIDSLLERGVLQESSGQLRLAPEAYLVSNEIFQEFLAPDEDVNRLASAVCP
jgi:oxygen-independent coproporphyrinogen III oxidase